MAIDYTEKRNFIRMQTDSRIIYRPQGSQDSFEGRCVNLSAAGVLFITHQRFDPGTIMNINITPEHSVVPPLDATIEVVRANLDMSGKFAIGARITDIH